MKKRKTKKPNFSGIDKDIIEKRPVIMERNVGIKVYVDITIIKRILNPGNINDFFNDFFSDFL